MLDINLIRQNPELIRESVKKRGMSLNVERLLDLDKKRRQFLQEGDIIRAQQKTMSQAGMTEAGIAKAKELKKQIGAKNEELQAILLEYEDLLKQFPNILLGDVPEGLDETRNVAVRKWGRPKPFDFIPKDHVELGRILDIIDIDRAAKITGTRFAYLKGAAALIQMGLMRLVFDVLTSEKIIKKIARGAEGNCSTKPFIPVFPPVMIRPDIFERMARLSPEDKNERYYIAQDDIYLIGSAEHALGPLHMDEVLQGEELPLRYIGFSSSFRREAGSYGKDVRGIMRVHQFDKLEMETFTMPEDSAKEQNFLVAVQEYLLRQLGLPYQVVMVCAGEMGKPDARQIDIETWIPSQERYRETHTADLMLDYQSRRLNTKFQLKNGQRGFVHMNDATAFAVGRILIAILENYQERDGTVRLPKILQRYTGLRLISPPS